MSLEVRCTCGWRCKASEYYLGDCITCPDCGAKVAVNARSSIPYGYAPYPTWQKRFPVRTPEARRALFVPPEDPHATSAMWLGIFALLATLTGCGVVMGLLLAAFGFRQSLRSLDWTRRQGEPVHGRAQAGLVLATMAVVFAGAMFLSFAIERPSSVECRAVPEMVETPKSVRPPYRYTDNNAAQRDLERRLRERAKQAEAWERSAREQGYRYPAPPRQQVAPKNDFQRRQIEYSSQIREQRGE